MLNWVEVSAPALRNNVAEFRRRLGEKVKLGAVVKSNAYGHGMLEVAAMATAAGADWLCVNQVDEGVALRQAGHETPILVMGYVELGRLADVVAHGLRPVVYNPETVERLEALAAQAGRQVRVHVKVETGTHRQGVLERDLPAFAERIRRSPHLVLEGMTTHFANIEDTTDHRMAESQIATFERAHGALAGAAGAVPVRHAACSAAALLFTRTHLELARIGISMYGLWPSKETYVSLLERGKPALGLQPVLAWKTRVAQVKDVPEGATAALRCSPWATSKGTTAASPASRTCWCAGGVLPCGVVSA
jgi:alanine racemase